MSTLSPISLNAANTESNDRMFDGNANSSSNVVLYPLRMIAENQEAQLLAECVMPSIYLTKDFTSWKEEQLRAHGFTHIIIIDKHIQELYYPNQKPDIFKLCSMSMDKAKNLIRDNSSSLNAFDDYCLPPTAVNHLSFGKEFEVIDLNFGEKSYLTTVLPNCYRAVKFINKALQACGTILVIDCNGGEQKCLTIVVAYLMYKHNISFSNAFARLKEFYKKADLDRFYISQLYEYEPILQVQRAQSRGHSCSRELHAAILKRKKVHDDDGTTSNITCLSTSADALFSSSYVSTNPSIKTTTELLSNCNPLNRFNTAQMENLTIKTPNHHNHILATQHNHNTHHTFSRFMSVTASSTPTTTTTTASRTAETTTAGGWYNWDDYAME